VSQASIPVIARNVSKPAKILSMLLAYGFAVPYDWIRRQLGMPPLIATALRGFRSAEGWKSVFSDYEPTAHDVFVSTFAKSGTNWMMQIAYQIAFRGAGEYANIHDAVPWPDMDRRRGRRMAIALDDPLVQQLSPTGLRIIKTHLSADHVPYSEQARYVVVVRDPKEVFVSSWYFAGGVAGPLMPPPDVWLDLFVDGRFPLDFGSNWVEHTAGYWALKDRPNVLVLSFSEMKRDLASAVRQVAGLMRVDLSPAELGQVIEKSSFAYMKGINEKFSPFEPDALPWGEGFSMMREGRSGHSHELLTPAQQASIDDWCRAELARIGSDFPYDDFFASRATASGGIVGTSDDRVGDRTGHASDVD
jgi:hypothetical protein